MRNKNTLPWVLLGLISLIWGSSFILIKKGLLVFNAPELGTLRIFMASLVLLPFGIQAIKRIPRGKIPYIFIVGFVGSYIPAMLFAYAQTRVGSAITGVINSFTPIFVSLFGALFFNLRMTRMSAFGIIIGFLGCIFIMLGGAHFDISGINLYGFFILAATIMYGINANIIKSFLPEIKALDITAVSFSLIFPICATYLFLGTAFTDKISSEPDFLMGFGYIAILGIIGTALAMFIFNNLVKMASPVFAASCTYIIPLVAIIWGLLDGETLNIYQYSGVVIVLVGVYLANRK
ncbi:DMT family transporter [Reichenbachiella agarivorans]|uniref:DMT family transporter n=1 Tax=Reichenbachiella agarivorans TaxID=2979464 RepID=A0ABY6CSK2_9BACT|nr:DMT family transporter [Reichenbachiella agarivorans]UXP33497.1 DMT family transporter [Reichenbachiella agarivorans]